MDSESPIDLRAVCTTLTELALAAGERIMTIYDAGPCPMATKRDGSPVTAADLAADAIITDGIRARLPGMDWLCEEAEQGHRLMPDDQPWLLIDPLDGTREFLNRTGEFTVNIAVILAGKPVAGVVAAPALGRAWRGVVGCGAEAAEGGAWRAIHARPRPAGPLLALASRSHPDAGTEAFLAGLPIGGRRSIGSSLKFCLLAEGEADVYPRFGPTMEWDIGAGQAVLEAAGGRVVRPDGSALRYNRVAEGFRTGPFVAWGAA